MRVLNLTNRKGKFLLAIVLGRLGSQVYCTKNYNLFLMMNLLVQEIIKTPQQEKVAENLIETCRTGQHFLNISAGIA